MKQIRYADFELAEYENRVTRAQAAMDDAGLDVMVITDPANLRYLFGFQNLLQTSANRSFVGLFPKERVQEAALFIPHDCQDAPQSWVQRVTFWDEGHTPPFDDRMADVTKVRDRIEALGLSEGRIGIELGAGIRPGMSPQQFDELRCLFRKARLCDASEVMWSLRKIKSQAEIELLRRVGSISQKAIRNGLNSLREDLTERELFRWIQAGMFHEGVDGQGLLCVQFGVDGWKRANMAPTDQRRLKKGEWAYVDGGGVLQGYNADICRMGVCGESDQDRLRIYETVGEIMKVLIHSIELGTPCSALYERATDLRKKAGLGEMICSLSIGHGIGLNVHEMPDLNLNNHEPIQEGMVLSIEPWVLDRSAMGLFNVEDMVVVRSGGAEWLTKESV